MAGALADVDVVLPPRALCGYMRAQGALAALAYGVRLVSFVPDRPWFAGCEL